MFFFLVSSTHWLQALLSFFFFNDTATTEIYTLSLHDALPIYPTHKTIEKFGAWQKKQFMGRTFMGIVRSSFLIGDRKSTRLNSSHGYISYAVFCLKKKKSHKF